MGVPITYRRSSEGALATYSYNDIAEGTGVLKLYGFNTEDSVSKKYTLSENAVYSSDIETGGTGAAGTSINVNFDLSPFNMPKTIGGTALVGFAVYLGAVTTATFTAQIIKVAADATTTVLLSVTSKTCPQNTQQKILMKGAIAQTHFKRGETLRLNILGNQVANGGLVFGHDPQNRAGTYVTDYPTILELYIPFKLDL